MDYHTLLIKSGYYIYKKCICSGVSIHQYKNKQKKNVIVYIYPKRKTFSIQTGSIIKMRGAIINLAAALEKI